MAFMTMQLDGAPSEELPGENVTDEEPKFQHVTGTPFTVSMNSKRSSEQEIAHRLLIMFNAGINESPKASLNLSFEELAAAIYSALDFDRAVTTFDGFTEDSPEGLDFTGNFGLLPPDPVECMKNHRQETADMIKTLEGVVAMLKFDLPRYDEWINAQEVDDQDN